MSKRKGGVEKDQKPAIESNPFKLAGIGDTAGLKALVERDKDPVDVNAKDEYGCQAIVWAARNGYVDTVKYLLDKGADIESSGFGGLRPIHHACNQLKDNVMQALIEHGADVNARDENGNTALHYAAERGVLEPVEKLLKAGAGVDTPNNAGTTPMMKACNDGHLSIVQRLVKSGADINAQDSKGNSALHIAAMNKFRPMIGWLLSNSANKQLRNKSSKTPQELAGPLAKMFDSDQEYKEYED